MRPARAGEALLVAARGSVALSGGRGALALEPGALRAAEKIADSKRPKRP